MSAEKLLRDMSHKLGLNFETQDWGIINSDPRRLLEFIDFYQSEPLTATQRFELGELVIASANERLLDGVGESDEGIRCFVTFIRQHKEEQSVHISYWSNLKPNEAYPVAAVLKAIQV